MGGGGAERQLAYLAAPLRDRGWDVHVALVADGPNLPRLLSGGASVHRLPVAGNYDPRLPVYLARVLRTVRPDLVQVWFIQMEVTGGLLAELAGIPWILSERSSAAGYSPTLKNRVRRLLARTADAIVSNSTAGDDYWRQRAPATVPRFIIPNALPLEEIDAVGPGLPPGVSVRPGDKLVIFAGRFGPEKNVSVLVAALRTVVERSDVVALLCGDGPLRPPLQRQIDNWQLHERILLPGYVTELWPVMKRADLVLSVGLYEGHPNVVMEAMAAGRPLVVSDIPAHRELLGPDGALFVNPSDADALAQAITEALERPAEMRRRAVVARTRAAQWSIAAAAAEYDRVYRSVLTAGRSAAS
jgi:glycosyltransferase involved in cell wall biosynthesis